MKEEKQYKKWKNLEMEWINHHDPILEIMADDGSIQEQIDLSELDYDGMGQLLDGKGFARQ